jgi:hypothetical protein
VPEPLVHIGYHKTGSSWLQERVFCNHAYGFHEPTMEQRLAMIDEAFVVPGPFSFERDEALRVLQPIFDGAQGCVPVLSHERLSGDPRLGGVDARVIADRLYETLPTARVLIVIREQRDMLVSVHKAEVRNSTASIERRWPERTVAERRTAGPSLEYFEYHRLIAYYQKLFGHEHVLVLPYETLRTDPLGFVRSITNFVGLPAPAEVQMDLVNESLPSAILAVMRYLNVVYRALGLSRWFDEPLEERRVMRGELRFFNNISPAVPKALSRAVERRWRRKVDAFVGDRFAESNRKTSELTGLDLASLGYDVS